MWRIKKIRVKEATIGRIPISLKRVQLRFASVVIFPSPPLPSLPFPSLSTKATLGNIGCDQRERTANIHKIKFTQKSLLDQHEHNTGKGQFEQCAQR